MNKQPTFLFLFFNNLIMIGCGYLIMFLIWGVASPRVTFEQLAEEMLALPEPSRPVLIEVVDLDEDGLYGTCDLKEEDQKVPYYLIQIDDDCSAELASFILIHEWAHALAWEEARDGDHSAAWGEAYARCYVAMFPED